MCLARLMSCDTMKQSVCGWQYVYIAFWDGWQKKFKWIHRVSMPWWWYIWYFIYSSFSFWLTVVEGDTKASFSIAITPRFKGGYYSFAWIVPLALDPYFLILGVKQGGIKYHFLSLWWDWTPVSWTIGKHSYHYTNRLVLLKSWWWVINTKTL